METDRLSLIEARLSKIEALQRTQRAHFTEVHQSLGSLRARLQKVEGARGISREAKGARGLEADGR
jgi:DNA repair ATPase RecN